MEQNKLLIVRDVLSREVYNLENKIMESRVYKMKYKYLEERKQILEEFIKKIDISIIEGKTIMFDVINDVEIDLPSI